MKAILSKQRTTLATCALLGILSGCAPPARTVTSADSTCTLDLPAGWRDTTKLHKAAIVQVHRGSEECYVVVLSGEKAKINYKKTYKSLKDFGLAVMAARAKKLKNFKDTSLKEHTLNGLPAVRFEYQAVSPGGPKRIAYLHTIIEGKTRVYEIIAWTTAERIAENRSTLEEVVATFKEISK